ncbi:MAG TPA: ATP-dependent Clp protease proteolytic subunit [Polyangiaceae bacterium]|nr:ATP-dependent Clp protease proteolytic subunit [Polyangiaceae bacterium]
MPTDAPNPPSVHPPPRVFDELWKARTLLLFGEITMQLAEVVSAQILALASASDAPIRLLINSPGGHVEAGDTIHDVIRFVDARVVAVGTGWVASAAALVYVAAPRERRLSLPNTRFLLHEPRGGASGPASDVEIEASQVLSMRARLNRIFAEATGQPIEKIARETQRNHWMNAEAARDYGLVGRIVSRVGELGID